ncbi:hypothetical protein D9758_003596 [Tetrapyrgos nigripes]|uniref:S-adenosyl-L-methionine-dependent methyltransferase n=1 Tax=Tetrapyrgos nigripes TaxID=182062 RepID=A0A8H5GUQ5_9AGAR|nr:hypothetical protein D9758_003596 [Tetrapyrgos nigripes]
MSQLKALVDIITQQSAILQEAYATSGSEVPSLDGRFQPGPLEFDFNLAHTRQLMVGAALQLIATVQSPGEYLQDFAFSFHKSATIGFVVDVNIPEILADAGTDGLHVDDIAKEAKVNPSHLARVLRFLAIRHIFQEVRPNVFAHNRVSTMLIRKKTLKEIRADPVGRFDESPWASNVHLAADVGLRSAPYLSSYLQNPDQAPTAFNIMLKNPKTLWEYFEEPGNEWRVRRFSAVMDSWTGMLPPEITIEGEYLRNTDQFRAKGVDIGIDGNALKPNDVVVDVGGNVGPAALLLKNAYPHLRYVVQDLSKPIAEGEKFWNEKDPEAIKSGQVTLQAHDFFSPQPVKNAAVYFLRGIVHNWSDAQATQILSHLREAAAPSSKLVIFDMLGRHTCEDPNLEGLDLPKAPYPLLAQLGVELPSYMDMVMLMYLGGQERTKDEFAALGLRTGWKLERVKPGILATFVFTAI